MPFGSTNRFMRTVQVVHEKVGDWIKAAQGYAKFWAALIGGALVIVSGELPLPEEVTRWVQIVVGLLTAFSVYQFPNVPKQ